jgi:tetrahydromethanopterin S-methyltransferase subunit F
LFSRQHQWRLHVRLHAGCMAARICGTALGSLPARPVAVAVAALLLQAACCGAALRLLVLLRE